MVEQERIDPLAERLSRTPATTMSCPTTLKASDFTLPGASLALLLRGIIANLLCIC
jgi:hypothetical protein